jgi:hypothetical protein
MPKAVTFSLVFDSSISNAVLISCNNLRRGVVLQMSRINALSNK